MEIHDFNSRERLFHALVRTVEVIFPFQPRSSFWGRFILARLLVIGPDGSSFWKVCLLSHAALLMTYVDISEMDGICNFLRRLPTPAYPNLRKPITALMTAYIADWRSSISPFFKKGKKTSAFACIAPRIHPLNRRHLSLTKKNLPCTLIMFAASRIFPQSLDVWSFQPRLEEIVTPRNLICFLGFTKNPSIDTGLGEQPNPMSSFNDIFNDIRLRIATLDGKSY